MELRPEEITKIIRSQIKNYENKIEAAESLYGEYLSEIKKGKSDEV